VIGKAARRCAEAMGSCDPFSVDLDPRWAKKLPAGSFAARRYLEHVQALALAVLETQDVGVIFSTPAVLDGLVGRAPPDRRRTIRGLHLGGLPVGAAQRRSYQEHFPDAVILSGYGNTLFGMMPELGFSAEDGIDYFPYGLRMVVQVLVQGDDSPAGGRLAGVLGYPAEGPARRWVLLCPPHPHFAGDMHNNVIEALAEHLSADSVTLRFDYRGVGQSRISLPEGVSVFDYWARLEELQDFADPLADAASAAEELRRAGGGLPLAVVGYSFGAVIALRLGQTCPRVAAVAGVSLPMTRVNCGDLVRCPGPCLLVTGANDFVYSAVEAARLSAQAGPGVRWELLDAVDHFFRGQEADLAARVGEFVRGGLVECDGAGLTLSPGCSRTKREVRT
jgi:alpha/beta superfamily hydrolase